MKEQVIAVILAGGKGSRLDPLTRDRAKPAVPFGGAYRIIDFTLSNCLKSGIKKVLILTQYKAMSLDRHITVGWQRYFCRELGEFADVVPPQQRIDESWYRGTADAVYQNIYTIEKEISLEKHRPTSSWRATTSTKWIIGSCWSITWRRGRWRPSACCGAGGPRPPASSA